MDYYAKDEFVQHYIHIQFPLLGKGDYLENIDEVVEFDMSAEDVNQMIDFGELSGKDYICHITFIYHMVQKVLLEARAYRPLNILEDTTYIKLIDYMSYNLHFNMSVATMAEYCGQSISDFSRKFKQSVGISPKAYLHNLIFDRASQLLLTSDYSIKEIAHFVGLDDSMYFSRFFKKACGMSPKTYRNSKYLTALPVIR
jgi:AraC-like DNA-binding protein